MGATKWKNWEIRAVIKYFYKKEMSPKEIHENFMDTLGKESRSYRTLERMGSIVSEGEREH